MIMPASHSKQQAVKLECVEVEGGTREGNAPCSFPFVCGALQRAVCCFRCTAAVHMPTLSMTCASSCHCLSALANEQPQLNVSPVSWDHDRSSGNPSINGQCARERLAAEAGLFPHQMSRSSGTPAQHPSKGTAPPQPVRVVRPDQQGPAPCAAA